MAATVACSIWGEELADVVIGASFHAFEHVHGRRAGREQHHQNMQGFRILLDALAQGYGLRIIVLQPVIYRQEPARLRLPQCAGRIVLAPEGRVASWSWLIGSLGKARVGRQSFLHLLQRGTAAFGFKQPAVGAADRKITAGNKRGHCLAVHPQASGRDFAGLEPRGIDSASGESPPARWAVVVPARLARFAPADQIGLGA